MSKEILNIVTTNYFSQISGENQILVKGENWKNQLEERQKLNMAA